MGFRPSIGSGETDLKLLYDLIAHLEGPAASDPVLEAALRGFRTTHQSSTGGRGLGTSRSSSSSAIVTNCTLTAPGTHFVGDVKEKKPWNGRGCYKKQGGVRIGFWSAGQFSGIIKYPDDSIYTGTVRAKGGPLNGQGRYVYSNKTVEEGRWSEGKRVGSFLITYKDGNKWSGEYISDVPMEGRGTLIDGKGTKREGEWKGGQFFGKTVSKVSNVSSSISRASSSSPPSSHAVLRPSSTLSLENSALSAFSTGEFPSSIREDFNQASPFGAEKVSVEDDYYAGLSSSSSYLPSSSSTPCIISSSLAPSLSRSFSASVVSSPGYENDELGLANMKKIFSRHNQTQSLASKSSLSPHRSADVPTREELVHRTIVHGDETKWEGTLRQGRPWTGEGVWRFNDDVQLVGKWCEGVPAGKYKIRTRKFPYKFIGNYFYSFIESELTTGNRAIITLLFSEVFSGLGDGEIRIKWRIPENSWYGFPHGLCEVQNPDKSLWKGEYSYGVPWNGSGSYWLASRWSVNGRWVQGELDGECTFKNPNGTTWNGIFRKGSPWEGKGSLMIFGSSQSGVWVQGKLDLRRADSEHLQ